MGAERVRMENVTGFIGEYVKGDNVLHTSVKRETSVNRETVKSIGMRQRP